jgi:hypothetical protein
MVSSSPVTGRAMAFSISYDGAYYCINVMEMELHVTKTRSCLLQKPNGLQWCVASFLEFL